MQKIASTRITAITTSTPPVTLTFGFIIALLCCCCCHNNYAQARPDQYDAAAELRSFKSETKEDGSYKFQYETTNGIAAGEAGIGGSYASGSYGYYAPDGQLFQLSYTADENGFHPAGEHLPTSPPIPKAIQKSLEYIRAHQSQQAREQEEEAAQRQTATRAQLQA